MSAGGLQCASVFMAYIDESGNKGLNGSYCYSLGVVLIDSAVWPSAFNDLIAFRRQAKQRFGIPVRAELKANFLLHNKGPLRALALSESARFAVYRAHMRMLHKIGAQCFAVVIQKQLLATKQPGRDPFEVAWEYALQRLERFATKSPTNVLIVHDEGEPRAIRALSRKARRAGTAGSQFGMGYLRVPFDRLVDDPVSRDSQQSYFVQLADLCAYAAFRHVHAPPPRPVNVVPQTMWTEAGTAILTAVSAKGPQGIVLYPT